MVDNLETLGGGEFSELYDALPDTVTYLVTSRIGVGEFERRYPLEPLSDRDAVQMFNDLVRARRSQGRDQRQGMGDHDDLRRLRCVGDKPGERRQAVAVTLAASYDTWCLAQIAKDLGRQEDAAFFLIHSTDYRNLWKKETGFFHPKDKDGNWIMPFDYKYAGGQGARDYYDENNAWTYIWDVPHNIGDLIALFGSRQAFTDKLDRLFVEGFGRPSWEFYNVLPDSTGNVGMFVMGNEPSFHIPYLYNYAGEPWKTQKRVRMLMEAWFRNDLMGICGDEDGGGMSAFAVFSSMGFYPSTPGVPNYTFGSPIFSKIALRLDNGKRFVLTAPKADHENKYIQSAKVNGKPCDKTWFSHDVLVNGGTVTLEMGDRPNKSWGTGPDAAPFSQGPTTK